MVDNKTILAIAKKEKANEAPYELQA
jgi:hypothetical protein